MSRVPPTISTQTPGQYLTAALWNSQVGGLASFGLTPPFFHGIQGTVQSIPVTTPTTINFTSALYDTEGGWSSSVNPSRYTIQVPGKYLVIANLAVGGNAGSTYGMSVNYNGAVARYFFCSAASGVNWQGQCTMTQQCVVGDYFQLQAIQNSPAAQNTVIVSYGQPSLEIYWISE